MTITSLILGLLLNFLSPNVTAPASSEGSGTESIQYDNVIITDDSPR